MNLFHGDCLEVLGTQPPAPMLFADPPDNIGLAYDEFKDRQPDDQYINWLGECLDLFVRKAEISWISFNAKWVFPMGRLVEDLLRSNKQLRAKPCVQTFTFGQALQTDMGNNHRPLWRIMWKDAKLYPNQIRVPSWRQEHGDKRADPRGRIPGDVFDFTRVTGNSKQRRKWNPTQLNEGLVERCVLFSTAKGDRVIDPFGGTGTTLRVCRRVERRCTLIEYDRGYCQRIAEENGLNEERDGCWSC